MRTDLQLLQPYPFARLRALLADDCPPSGLSEIRLSVGEPQLPPPSSIFESRVDMAAGLSAYPATQGMPGLRLAIANWLERRFALGTGAIDPETMVLPVNGTREALFAVAQATIDPGRKQVVAMPNPCYQIYEGAAILAGADVLRLAPGANGLPDLAAVADDAWRRCRLLYVCSPDNPTGAVADVAWFQRALELASRHDFCIASDECYSEIYPSEREAPASILQAAQANGLPDFKHCLAFHSLSKRSNLPGLRSGFVAGDPELIADFLLYRTYHGCAMSPLAQEISLLAWSDEQHVIANRRHYDAAFAAFLEALPAGTAARPAGGFYVWLKTPENDLDFTRRVYREANVIVLPGSFLGRDSDGVNPGAGYVRISLVDTLERCREAGRRIARCIVNG